MNQEILKKALTDHEGYYIFFVDSKAESDMIDEHSSEAGYPAVAFTIDTEQAADNLITELDRLNGSEDFIKLSNIKVCVATSSKKINKKITDYFEQSNIVNYKLRNCYELFYDKSKKIEYNEEEFKAAYSALMKQNGLEGKAPDREEYEKKNARNLAADMLRRYESGDIPKAIGTGIAPLDEALNGGILPGLIFIGAESGLGKTTFITQIADYMAAQRKRILYFSLEMATDELIAKSLSRESFRKSKKNEELSWSTAEVLSQNRYVGISEEKLENLSDATDSFYRYAANIIYETDCRTIEQIEQETDNFKAVYGESPVIFIDYLQIIGTEEKILDKRQAVDTIITRLKRLSVKHNTPVICISSLNRSGNGRRPSMEYFKESGTIEYSSDILIGMAIKVDSEEEREAQIARANAGGYELVEAVILKNRKGVKDKSIPLAFYPRYNIFYPVKFNKGSR